MKREIKFRALKDDMSNCKFVYGQLIYRKEELSGNVHPSITEDGILFNSCLSNTESQFTGLTDKNGKEIYEGDILECVSNNEFSLGSIDNYEVMWGIDSWHIKDTFMSLQELFNYSNNNVKIIGNIYENPNLLSND